MLFLGLWKTDWLEFTGWPVPIRFPRLRSNPFLQGISGGIWGESGWQLMGPYSCPCFWYPSSSWPPLGPQGPSLQTNDAGRVIHHLSLSHELRAWKWALVPTRLAIGWPAGQLCVGQVSLRSAHLLSWAGFLSFKSVLSVTRTSLIFSVGFLLQGSL